MKQPNYYEILRLMSNWTVLDRLQWTAQECQNLEEVLYPFVGHGTTAGKAWGLIKLGMYQPALELLAEATEATQ